MKYLGGKGRIGSRIANEILSRAPGLPIWEPFAGGLNASEFLRPSVCSDADDSLISLFEAVRAGWNPPESITEEEYHAARSLPCDNPLYGFCAFGCSWGGKKWGGYARDRSGKRNYADENRRWLTRVIRGPLKESVFQTRRFSSLIPDGITMPAAVYCDPPYVGRTGYGDRFDHHQFVTDCAALAKFGHRVFVSEYEKLDSAWVQVAEFKRAACLRGRETVHSEKLFLVQ